MLVGFLSDGSMTSLTCQLIHSNLENERGMTIIDWHVKQLEWWKERLGVSDYGVAWIAFIKGLALGYALCAFF